MGLAGTCKLLTPPTVLFIVPIGLAPNVWFMLLKVDLPLGKPPFMLVACGWNAAGSTALYTVTPSMPPPFGVTPCASSFFHCCFSR